MNRIAKKTQSDSDTTMTWLQTKEESKNLKNKWAKCLVMKNTVEKKQYVLVMSALKTLHGSSTFLANLGHYSHFQQILPLKNK